MTADQRFTRHSGKTGGQRMYIGIGGLILLLLILWALGAFS